LSRRAWIIGAAFPLTSQAATAWLPAVWHYRTGVLDLPLEFVLPESG
jgi:hypothetical protein